MKIAGSTVWVIGASSGIGAAVARELHARGARVVVSARTEEKLARVAGGALTIVPVDVTDRGAVRKAAGLVEDAVGPPDTVVICSGLWEQGRPGELDLDSFSKHVETNVLGMATCIAQVLPGMRERGHGRIVGVASVAGYRGLPGAEAYGACKAAQINLLESLRAGLRGTDVQVQTVCPGFVDTPMTSDNSFPMPFIIAPEQAARAIANGIAKDRAEIVFPLRMAVLMKVARLVPVRLWAGLAAPSPPLGHRSTRRGTNDSSATKERT